MPCCSYTKIWEKNPQCEIFVSSHGVRDPYGHPILKIKYSLCLLQPGAKGFGYQGFYCSTGINSTQPDLWFPFDGITYDSFGRNLHLQKVESTQFSSRFRSMSQKPNPDKQILRRFGCLFFIFLSSLLSDPTTFHKFEKKTYKFLTKQEKTQIKQWTEENILDLISPLDFKSQAGRPSVKTVNMFIGNALSVNYLRGVEEGYASDFLGDPQNYLDYNEIYSGKIYTVYEGSRLLKPIERPLYTQCPGLSNPFIMDFFLDQKWYNISNYARMTPGNQNEIYACERVKLDQKKQAQAQATTQQK